MSLSKTVRLGEGLRRTNCVRAVGLNGVPVGYMVFIIRRGVPEVV